MGTKPATAQSSGADCYLESAGANRGQCAIEAIAVGFVICSDYRYISLEISPGYGTVPPLALKVLRDFYYSSDLRCFTIATFARSLS
jgi:hypothetical protein